MKWILVIASALFTLAGRLHSAEPSGRLNIVLFLIDDLGETNNLAAAKPELVGDPRGELDAYVFDLGKSYGAQDATAFRAMLQTVRRSHPQRANGG